MEVLAVDNKVMSVNGKLAKAVQGTSTGDMKKSVYDPNGTVEAAGGIPDYVEANGGKIDIIKVNGMSQTITNKTVDIAVPTNNNQLVNGAGYISEIPIASTTQLGGVKIGNGLSIALDGTLSATGGGGSSEAFVAVFGIHGENTYDKSPTHAATTTYENIIAAYNAKTPCYAKIRLIGTDYEGYVVAPLAYVDEVYGEVYFASTRMTKGNTPKELIICYAAIDFEGNAEGYFGIQYTLSSADKVLPSVTTSDNGKFLRVVSGAWAAVTIPDANGVSF